MAGAGVVFDVDFDEMSVGSPPSTGLARIEPSGCFAVSPTSCLVQQQYGDLQNKPLVFVDGSTAAAAKVWFELPNPQGRIQVAWRSVAGQVARGGEMTLYGSGIGVMWMRYDATGRFYVGHGNGSGQETSSLVGSYSPGVADSLRIDLNLGLGRFSLVIDGVVVLQDVPTLPGATTLEAVMFGTETSEPDPPQVQNTYGFDDLTIDISDVAGVSPLNGEGSAQTRVWPNPFTDRVEVAFRLWAATPVRMEVFDISGRYVWSSPSTTMGPGLHTLAWNGRATNGSPSTAGTYFLRVRGPGIAESRTVVRVN
jgi:hypothetical protein